MRCDHACLILTLSTANKVDRFATPTTAACGSQEAWGCLEIQKSGLELVVSTLEAPPALKLFRPVLGKYLILRVVLRTSFGVLILKYWKAAPRFPPW